MLPGFLAQPKALHSHAQGYTVLIITSPPLISSSNSNKLGFCGSLNSGIFYSEDVPIVTKITIIIYV